MYFWQKLTRTSSLDEHWITDNESKKGTHTYDIRELNQYLINRNKYFKYFSQKNIRRFISRISVAKLISIVRRLILEPNNYSERDNEVDLR